MMTDTSSSHTLPNADDPRGGTPMNTDDELRQRAITALKSSVMSFTDYGAKQIWEALAPIIVTDRCKSTLQRAIDTAVYVASMTHCPLGEVCSAHKTHDLGEFLTALQAELQQVEKEQA